MVLHPRSSVHPGISMILDAYFKRASPFTLFPCAIITTVPHVTCIARCTSRSTFVVQGSNLMLDLLPDYLPLPEPERVLVIMAHPDDIEYFVGGTIAHWTAAGVMVTALLATSGQHGTQDEVSTPPEMAAQREREQRAASAVLGVRDVIFLGEADGELEPTLELRLRLVRVIRRVRPDIVVLPDPLRYYFDGYVNHPDHRAAGEAALAAVSPASANRLYHPELIAEGLMPHRASEVWVALAVEPDFWVDITSVIEQKAAAFRCHASQITDWPSMEAAIYASSQTVLPNGQIVHREAYRRIRIG